MKLSYIKLLSVFCAALLQSACSLMNSFDEPGIKALHNANYLVFADDKGYFLNFDYNLVCMDIASLLNSQNYPYSTIVALDESDNKAFIYKKLLSSYGIRTVSDSQDSNAGIFLSFNENEIRTELFVRLLTKEGSISRLYSKDGSKTYAISPFNFENA